MSGSFNSGNWPPVTKNLIIINLIIWLVEFLFPQFGQNGIVARLGLHYVESDLFNPAQLLTYMFVHDPRNIMHVFFNMFTLWMFGRMLEHVWGSKRFLLFYMVCGVGGAVLQEIIWACTWEHDYIAGIAAQNLVTYDHMKQIVDQWQASGSTELQAAIADFQNRLVVIGASGAIYGILLGFAFVFPNMPLYLFFIPVPIKAKYMVIGYAVLEFFFGVSGRMDSVAHFAHLGGMLFGLILLFYWKKKGLLRGGGFY